MATTNIKLGSYIQKVLKQVHPDTGSTESAKDSVNNLLNLLLTKLVQLASSGAVAAKRVTLDAEDFRKAINLLIPGELGRHGLSESFKALTKFSIAKERQDSGSSAAKAGLTFPPSRILGAKQKPQSSLRNIRSITSASRVSPKVGLVAAAILEYIAAEILELAGSVARDKNKVRITTEYLRLAIEGDSELSDLFEGVLVAGTYITRKEE